jgi:hypothetical protein
VTLPAVTRVVPEFLDVVEQSLDEADGRLSALLVKFVKLVASKHQCEHPARKKPEQKTAGRLRGRRDRAITPK